MRAELEQAFVAGHDRIDDGGDDGRKNQIILRVRGDAGRERVAAGRKAGGHGRSTEARARKAMPADLRSVGDMLLAAMQAVKDGEMTPSIAHALAGLARAYVDVTEYATFEARITAVEEATATEATAA